MNDELDLCHHFADFAANTRYEDLPDDAIEAAKKTILDTLGVTLAASGMEPAVRALVELLRTKRRKRREHGPRFRRQTAGNLGSIC